MPLGVIEMDGTSSPRPECARLPETEQGGFAELVCADPAWMRAEFDAIIAANFGTAAEQPEVPPPPSTMASARSPWSLRWCGPKVRSASMGGTR